MIKAECHSDDYLIEVQFDATPWFEQAEDDEIQALIDCDWRGDYPADAVALHMQDQNKKLKALFEYVVAAKDIGDGMGFEVAVDETSALKWLKENRPEIAEE